MLICSKCNMTLQLWRSSGNRQTDRQIHTHTHKGRLLHLRSGVKYGTTCNYVKATEHKDSTPTVRLEAKVTFLKTSKYNMWQFDFI